ncbi:unnamed protein product [Moneuplotes crassus]|uniref:Uncharacterized protein n=2 Tax=Euplotes crassus TaxID=5936 RepID=A0AAD1Y4S0_EUPCR|nr:unnamed protein product [Moneuplotes crassus]
MIAKFSSCSCTVFIGRSSKNDDSSIFKLPKNLGIDINTKKKVNKPRVQSGRGRNSSLLEGYVPFKSNKYLTKDGNNQYQSNIKHYFLTSQIYPEECPICPGVRSLYNVARIAQKQALYINIPPTILLGFNHKNLFMFTKPSTRSITVIDDEMNPMLIKHYLKNCFGKNEESTKKAQSSRIKKHVYPKYIIRYASKTDRNRIFLFYRLNDVYRQALEDWGKYDMAIQPYIISKSRKVSMTRYEVYHQGMTKSVSISSDYNLIDFPYLERSEIVNTRKVDIRRENSPKKTNAMMNIELHEIHNVELLKYFTVSTEVDIPKINLIQCRPSANKLAQKMSKDIAHAFCTRVKPKGYTLDNILIDFVESIEGITYFLQVKNFKSEKCMLPPKLNKSSLLYKFNSPVFQCNSKVFCELFDKKDPKSGENLADQMKNYLKQKLQLVPKESVQRDCDPLQLYKIDRNTVNIYKKEIAQKPQEEVYDNLGALYPLLYIPQTKPTSQKTFRIKEALVSGNKLIQSNEYSQIGEIKIATSSKGKLKCCYLCYCIFLCYQKRYKVLTFQTPQTKAVVASLSEIPASKWQLKDLKRLLDLYEEISHQNSNLDFSEKKSVIILDKKPSKFSVALRLHNKKLDKRLCCSSRKNLKLRLKSKGKLEGLCVDLKISKQKSKRDIHTKSSRNIKTARVKHVPETENEIYNRLRIRDVHSTLSHYYCTLDSFDYHNSMRTTRPRSRSRSKKSSTRSLSRCTIPNSVRIKAFPTPRMIYQDPTREVMEYIDYKNRKIVRDLQSAGSPSKQRTPKLIKNYLL